MQEAILTVNVGSSSIKFAVFFICNGKLGAKDYSRVYLLEKDELKRSYEFCINDVLRRIEEKNIKIVAVGHRFIQGGDRYKKPVVIDKEVIFVVENLKDIAPLHQPYSIKGYCELKVLLPEVIHVACFDTSFHTTCNKLSQLFALPQKFTKLGIRRYGYHGLSYEYVVSLFDEIFPKSKANGRIIAMHLGAGTTMCGIKNKKSVATSIGFSALDGLVMGTRCGVVDAGVLLHFIKHYKMSYEQLTNLLYKESGLLGISGITSDMKELLTLESRDAKLAVDLYVYRISQWIGTLSAELGGLDGLIFTGGIGENSSYIREQICRKAKWLGVKIDAEKNSLSGKRVNEIHHTDSKVFVYTVPSDEEVTIAKHTLNLFLKK